MSVEAESIRCDVRPSEHDGLRLEVAMVCRCDSPEEMVGLVRELTRLARGGHPSSGPPEDTNRDPI